MTFEENQVQVRFLKSLNNIYCRLGISTGTHGIGVFAIRKIPLHINPFRENYMGDFIPIEEAKIEAIEIESVKKMIKDFCPLQQGKYYVPKDGLGVIDTSFYLNHSSTPNMEQVGDALDFFTLREIEEGEELTVDYNTYDDNTQEDFRLTKDNIDELDD